MSSISCCTIPHVFVSFAQPKKSSIGLNYTKRKILKENLEFAVEQS